MHPYIHIITIPHTFTLLQTHSPYMHTHAHRTHIHKCTRHTTNENSYMLKNIHTPHLYTYMYISPHSPIHTHHVRPRYSFYTAHKYIRPYPNLLSYCHTFLHHNVLTYQLPITCHTQHMRTHTHTHSHFHTTHTCTPLLILSPTHLHKVHPTHSCTLHTYKYMYTFT